MGITNRLPVNAQALAAVAARMRLDELGATGDPAVRAQIDRAVDALGAGDPCRFAERGRTIDAGLLRALVSHAGARSRREPRASGRLDAGQSGSPAGAGLGVRRSCTTDHGCGPRCGRTDPRCRNRRRESCNRFLHDPSRRDRRRDRSLRAGALARTGERRRRVADTGEHRDRSGDPDFKLGPGLGQRITTGTRPTEDIYPSWRPVR